MLEPVAAIAFSTVTPGKILNLAWRLIRAVGTPGLLQCMYNYIFSECQCNRCTVTIREDNYRSIKLAKRLCQLPFWKVVKRKAPARQGYAGVWNAQIRAVNHGRAHLAPSKPSRSDHYNQCARGGQSRQSRHAVWVPDLR